MRILTMGVLVLLLSAGTSACGPELVGGSQGDVETVMTDSPGSSQNAAASSGPSMNRSAAESAHLLPIEGSLTAEVAVSLLTAGGGSLPLTAGAIRRTIGIGSQDRAVLERRRVEVGTYPGLRLTFTSVQAELLAGGVGPATVALDLSEGPLVVDVPVDVRVWRQALTTVELEMNSGIWLVTADPVTGIVSREVFANAIEVRVLEP